MIVNSLNNHSIVTKASQPIRFISIPDEPGMFILQGTKTRYTTTGVKRKLQAIAEEMQLPVQGCIEQPPQEQPKQKKKYATHPRTHKKNQPLVHIRSDIMSNAIEKGLFNPTEYKTEEEMLLAYARMPLEIDKQKGQVVLTIPVLPDSTWDSVTQAMEVLGDGIIDTFHVLVAISIQKHGLAHMREPIEFSPDTILEMTGKKKTNGTYTKEQRKEVLKHIKLLSHIELSATIPTYRARNKQGRSIASPSVTIAKGSILTLLNFELKEYDAITGEEILTMHSICFGPWVTTIPGITDKTALMHTKILEYSAKNEIYQKRIGRYLTKTFCFNALRNNCEFPHGIFMKTLFEGAGIEPPQANRGRFMEAIKVAINQLKKDNVIGGFTYEPLNEEIKARIHERARGWFDDYLNVKINFTPPKEALEHYKSFAKTEKQNCAGGTLQG